jgi:hypothetical protein
MYERGRLVWPPSPCLDRWQERPYFLDPFCLHFWVLVAVIV